MKLPCNIVQDLMPLYEDHLCSQATREAVEEHLRECEVCSQQHNLIQSIAEPEVMVESKKERKAMAKSFKKIRKHWIASLVVLLVVMLLLIPVGYLGWGQYSLTGPSFTNLHELYIATRFADCLGNKDYEGAFQYLDLEGTKQRWLDHGSLSVNKEAGFEEDAWELYQELAAEVDKRGGIQDIRYVGIGGYSKYDNGEDEYQVDFRIKFEDKELNMTLWVTDGGVTSGHVGYALDHPLEKLVAWSYPLYDKCNGFRYDPELGQMVPYED